MSLGVVVLAEAREWAIQVLVRFATRLRGMSLLGPWLGDALPAFSPEQLDGFAARLAHPSLSDSSRDGVLDQLGARLDAAAAGPDAMLTRLAERFGLDGPARRLLVFLAICQADTGLRELLGAVCGARWRPWPQAGRLCEALATSGEERAALRHALTAGGPLRAGRWVVRGPDPEGVPEGLELPFEGQTFLVPAPVASALLGGQPELGEGLQDIARRIERDRLPEFESLALDPELRERLADCLQPGSQAMRLALVGPAGTGVREVALAAALMFERAVIEVDVPRLLGLPVQMREERLALLRRSLGLLGDALVLETGAGDGDELAATLFEVARETGAPAFWVGRERPKGLERRLDGLDIIALGYPSPARRLALWAEALEQEGLTVDGLDPVAAVYELTGSDIRRVAGEVRRRRAGTLRQGTATRAEIEDACRDDLDLRLGGVTRRIRHATRFDDLVLLPDQRGRLDEIARYVRNFDALYDKWGFGRRFLTGRGAHCLFTGPPGTGKTMAASGLATDLDLPLYRVELSQVVDRYVGETEKRLAQIFDEAARAPCVLLFDEADSLFAKRTEVKSANDRYANLETNYLLQRMEECSGVVILTTNFEASLDAAVLRRVRFRVLFPEPDAALRARLWRELLPPEAEVDPAMEYELLASAFEMSGGHIKNAILRAALNAIHEKRPIDQDDLWNAACAEYQLLGRLPPASGYQAGS